MMTAALALLRPFLPYLAAAALMLAAYLAAYHQGAEAERLRQAAQAADAYRHATESRRDAEDTAAADADPAERLRRDWSRP